MGSGGGAGERRACRLCLEGARMCVCVCRAFLPLLDQCPGGSCLQTAGLPRGRQGGLRGQRVCAGSAGGKAAGTARGWRRSWLWVACWALPGTGSLSSLGWLHPGQPAWPEGPPMRDEWVLAAWSWQAGEATAAPSPSEWTAEGVVWQGVSASVFVSESGSCVCLRSPAGLAPCTPCGVLRLRAGAAGACGPGAVWEEEPRTSGRSILPPWPPGQMVSAAPAASLTSPKPPRNRVYGFKRIPQVAALQAQGPPSPVLTGGWGPRSGRRFTCPVSAGRTSRGSCLALLLPPQPPLPRLWALPASPAPLPCCLDSDGTVGSSGVCGPL